MGRNMERSKTSLLGRWLNRERREIFQSLEAVPQLQIQRKTADTVKSIQKITKKMKMNGVFMAQRTNSSAGTGRPSNTTIFQSNSLNLMVKDLIPNAVK